MYPSHHTHQKALCSQHGIRRYMSELVDVGDGTYRCLPSNECREIEMKMCAQHQRMRPIHQLEEIQPGVFQCFSKNPCREGGRAGVNTHTNNNNDGGEGSGNYGGGRGGRGGYGYRGGRGGGSGDGQQQQHQNFSARSFYMAGVVRERYDDGTNNGLGDYAASGVKFASGAFNRGGRGGRGGGAHHYLQNNKNNENLTQEHIQAANEAFQAKFNDQQSNAGFFNNNANNNQNQNNLDGNNNNKTQQQLQMLAMFNRQQQQQLQAGGHAKVWCCRHGREIELRTAKSIDGGMTYMCADPTECLGAPLDDPRALAAKGCEELWCKVHKRLRGPRWLMVAPDNSGFICRRPHGCRSTGGVSVNTSNNNEGELFTD